MYERVWTRDTCRLSPWSADPQLPGGFLVSESPHPQPLTSAHPSLQGRVPTGLGREGPGTLVRAGASRYQLISSTPRA